MVVGYLAFDDKASYEAFTSVAEAMHDDYVFGITNDQNLAGEVQSLFPKIVLYKDFDEEKNILWMSYDVEAIIAFIRAWGTPLVAEFHPELHYQYVDVGLSRHEKPVLTAYVVLRPGFHLATSSLTVRTREISFARI